MNSLGIGQVMSRPSDRRVNTQVSRSGFIEKSCLNDEALATSVVFQSMREKERQLREYKFKYDTLKLMYDELVSVLKQQAFLLPVNQQDCQKPHRWNQISAYMERELTNLRASKSEVSRILYGLQQKLSQVCSVFLQPESEIRERLATTGSVKVHRHDSQLETQEGRISSGADSAKSANYSVIGVASNRIDPSLGHRRQERPSQGISNLLLQRFLTNTMASSATMGLQATASIQHGQPTQSHHNTAIGWLGDKRRQPGKIKDVHDAQFSAIGTCSAGHLAIANSQQSQVHTGIRAEQDWVKPL